MADEIPQDGGTFYASEPYQGSAREAPYDRDPDLILRSDCHPGAQSPPSFGDHAWSFRVPLEDGKLLELQMGQRGHDALRTMLLQEKLEDEAEAVIAQALEEQACDQEAGTP